MKTRCYDFIMVLFLLLHMFLSVSCTNDTDLLTELVLSDTPMIETVVVNDRFVIQNNGSAVLDVLSNDGFSAEDLVRIVEISNPTHGSVTLGEDSLTIIYTPDEPVEEVQPENDTENDSETENDAETEDDTETENDTETEDDTASENDDDSTDDENQATTDSFTYTTELINEDETTSTEVGTVEVVIESTTEDEEDSTSEEEDSQGDADPGEEEGNADDTTGTEEEEDTDAGTGGEEEEDTSTPPTNGSSAKLLFSSGFEGVRLSAPRDGYQYLSGTDRVTGHSWPMRILGSDFSGIHRVNDGGGGAITNRIEQTEGPKRESTSALFQEVKYDVQVTQTPYQINNIKENPKELYMSYWMKTDDTAVKGIDKWRAIWEYKTDNYASNRNGFRMIAFMATDYQGKPYWLFQGDTSPQTPVWQAKNTTVPLILNEWFKVEYYIKWSDGADGYASMKVNGQLIGEHHGATTSNSDDMNFIMLTQVYGNSHPMHQWVDDIEIWDGLPPQ